MTSVEEAMAAVDASVRPLGTEVVAVVDAAGRVLAAPVASGHPLPRFDQSAVDGYAVRHADVAAAPVTLPVGEVVAAARQAARPVLTPGTATRIFTGGLVPDGADTIVRQELTTADADAGTVTVHDAVDVGTDLRREGEELPAGSVVATAGQEVTPGLLASLLVAGAHEVTVARRPRVAVLVTGDELVPAGQPLGLGQTPDTNGPMIGATLAGWGLTDVTVAHVPDRREVVVDTLAAAIADADLVVTSGGVSVGDFDFVPGAAEEVGAERLFWKVAQRPGGPLYVARHGDAHLFGLPGNPAAVLVNLHVYVRRALDRLVGLDPDARWRTGVPAEPPHRIADKTFWLRASATTDDTGRTVLAPLGRQASHMLSNLSDATAIARVPATSEDEPTETLRWLPLP
ncbi:MAG: molybdopterin molybdotransferase MoeA [Actinobacteria bacterium]|nr:molybdopterin molybdotransferase MoeA [Actinomycetota bacterium]